MSAVSHGTATDSLRFAGGEGADVVTTGVGVDNPAHAAFDGGPGADETYYDGTNDPDSIGIARDGTDQVAAFADGGVVLDNTGVEELDVRGFAGADAIIGQNGIGTLTHLTEDGGTGDDTLRRRRRRRPAARRLRQRPRRRQHRRGHGAARLRQRHVPVGSGRRQRHDRRPGRRRHAAVQRLQRGRGDRPLDPGRRPAAVPQRRGHHDARRQRRARERPRARLGRRRSRSTTSPAPASRRSASTSAPSTAPATARATP